MHEAIHEATHFLFPDSYGDENFHTYVSKMEILCAPLLDDVRGEVRKYMAAVKKESNELLSAMKFDVRVKKGLAQESISFKYMTKTGKKKLTITREMWENIGQQKGWAKTK